MNKTIFGCDTEMLNEDCIVLEHDSSIFFFAGEMFHLFGNKMPRELCEIFQKIEEANSTCDTEKYNRMLADCEENDQAIVACCIYEHMVKAHVIPNYETYDVMSRILGSREEWGASLELVEDVSVRGIEIDYTAYDRYATLDAF